jgi:methanogenic corrinoid protein MtbC1
VLDPAMEEVGRRWELDRMTVADEHLATAVAGRVMASTCVSLPRPPAVRGRVLVTTAPGEQHVLGARIVADLLERDGWDVLFLGADTPTGEVVRFARRQRPVFLGVSVALPTNVVAAADLVRAVRDDPVLRGVRVMVGGQAFRRHPELVAKVGGDGYASDAAAAAALARGWSTVAVSA